MFGSWTRTTPEPPRSPSPSSRLAAVPVNKSGQYGDPTATHLARRFAVGLLRVGQPASGSAIRHVEYVEGFLNRRRRHHALGWRTALEFETSHPEQLNSSLTPSTATCSKSNLDHRHICPGCKPIGT